MVETRVKPHRDQVAEQSRRDAQRQIALRNQVVGMLLLAAAILAWWLIHTNPKWIFPSGWWRL